MGCDNITGGVSAVNASTNADSSTKVIQHVIMKIIIPIICSFGILGNILNLVVLTRDKLHRAYTKMEKSAHIGLIALAVSDLMFCVLVFFVTILPSSSKGYPSKTYLIYVDLLGGPLISIFILTSTWLIVCMACERYIAVCHVLRARKILSLHRTKLILVLVFLICLILSIPLFFENVINEHVCSNNTTWYFVDSRKGYTDSLFSIRRLVWSVVADFIPSGALLFFNTCLIIHIQKTKKIRRKLVSQKNNGSSPKHWKFPIKYNNSRCTSTNQSASEQPNFTTKVHRTERSHHQETTKLMNSRNSDSYVQDMAAVCASQAHTRTRYNNGALNSASATLIAIVLLFLILVSPSEILKFAACTKRTLCKDDQMYLIIKTITNMMQSINFSVNFILYCAISQHFRETLRDFLCFCFTGNSDKPPSNAIKLPVRYSDKSAL